uniref:AWJL175 protein n=1 Tax=Triticum aestivum TaxID=4565 RepID=Q41536_WHEAT|nr:AWJL175 [Triticum aestivum]
MLLMYSNQIEGRIPESMCKLQSLLYLDLSNNILESEIPQCFDGKQIQFLLLSNNSLSGKFPAFLQNSTRLKFLDLAWNKFSGRLPTWIGELWKLRFLLLSHSALSGTIPVEITNLGYLQFLDLSVNNFSGPIPLHLSKLTFMKNLQEQFMPRSDNRGIHLNNIQLVSPTFGAGHLAEILSVITKGQKLIYGSTIAYFVNIDLSSNSLTGEIPTDITSLVALINLNLSSNQLSGQIPNMIGAVQSLVSLDLSQNKLYGEIPLSLSSLTSLSYLNLSYNSLSGMIPSGPQLDILNLDSQSLMYIGNSGLCGPPVHKNCPGNDSSIHGDLKSSNEEFDTLTFYFGLVLEFVVGLWMVFCALLFKKTWRIAYFRLFDKVYDQVYVFAAVKWASFAKNTDAE